MKLFEVICRFGSVLTSVIAFTVMSATGETRKGAGSTFKMSFHNFHACSYLVAVNFITFIYSTLQLIALGCSIFCKGSSCSEPCAYICDQVLLVFMFSASCSAATASDMMHHGVRNIWPPACSTWKLWIFCSCVDAAVVMSFLSSFFVTASAVFSGHKLYGNK